MPDHGEHCPFLNRADRRCSNFFSLERLEHAFGCCFNEYDRCPVYRELLVERRVRRSIGRVIGPAERADGIAVAATPLVQVTLHGRPGGGPAAAPPGADRYVQHAA